MNSENVKKDALKQAPSGRAPDQWTRRELKGIPASLGALWTQRDENGWRYGVQLDESHANAQGSLWQDQYVRKQSNHAAPHGENLGRLHWHWAIHFSGMFVLQAHVLRTEVGVGRYTLGFVAMRTTAARMMSATATALPLARSASSSRRHTS